jgi:hexosaminidase
MLHLHAFRATLPPSTQARFMRVRAANPGPLPAWHPGAGGKAWVFLDEVVIK